MKTLFMETTKIPVSQTVSEIQRILGQYGASAIMIEFENSEPSAIFFEIRVNTHKPTFRLPCRWKQIEIYLNKKHPPQDYIYAGEVKTRTNTDQAKRVAWRQILRWVEAQLALVETDMVTIQEVFLPYLETGKNQTLYELIEESKFKMIPYKEKSSTG